MRSAVDGQRDECYDPFRLHACWSTSGLYELSSSKIVFAEVVVVKGGLFTKVQENDCLLFHLVKSGSRD